MNFFDHKTMGRLINLPELEESGKGEIKVIFQRNGAVALIQT